MHWSETFPMLLERVNPLRKAVTEPPWRAFGKVSPPDAHFMRVCPCTCSHNGQRTRARLQLRWWVCCQARHVSNLSVAIHGGRVAESTNLLVNRSISLLT